MPLRYNPTSLKRAARAIRGVVTPGTAERKRMIGAAVNAIKALTREQFAKGIGPDGAPQPARKTDGRPGLESEKLARGAVAITAEGEVIRGRAKNPKWSAKLDAHQQGHTWPARSGVQRRDSKGRLITKSTFQSRVRAAASVVNTGNAFQYSKIGKRGKVGAVRATVQRTKGGARTLVPRSIYPAGGSTLTARWNSRIGEFVSKAIASTMATVRK